MDNSRSKTCYYSTLDSNIDLTIYKTTYTINKSLKEKTPLWIITFEFLKAKDSIAVLLYNKENDMMGRMGFKYTRAYFPVIFNKRDINSEALDCYDLLVNDNTDYKILFTIYNPSRPFIILNKFQPPGNNLVTYELSTLKYVENILDKNLLERHRYISTKFWLNEDKVEQHEKNKDSNGYESTIIDVTKPVDSKKEEGYYIIIAKAIDFQNNNDTAQALTWFNQALAYNPKEKFLNAQIIKLSTLPAQKINNYSKETKLSERSTPKIIDPTQENDTILSALYILDDKYDSILHIGSDLMGEGYNLKIAKDYNASITKFETAITTYNKASAVKPSESYPNKQIRYCMSEINEDIIQMEEKRVEDSTDHEQLLEHNFDLAYGRAESALKAHRFEDALSNYKEALNLLNDEALIRTGHKQAYKQDILQSIKICEAQLKYLRQR